jgi:hypothetical protein
MSEPIIRSVKTFCVLFFSTRGLLVEHDFHFGVFLPESVIRIVVGGYSSDFICFLLLLKIQSELLSRIWKLNFGKKFALIIICSAVFIVQLP